MAVLHVRNWQKHQNYHSGKNKATVPPWIKVYGALLDDPAFLALPEPAQAQLLKLWLLASRRSNSLPDNAKILRGLIGCAGRFYLPELIAGKWLEIEEENPRTILGRNGGNPRKDSGIPSRERARDREEGRGERGEVDLPSLPLQNSTTAARARFLAAMPKGQQATWAANLDGWLEGLGTTRMMPVSAEAIDVGLTEYLAGTPEELRDFKPRYVLAFVEKAEARRTATPAPVLERMAVRPGPRSLEDRLDAAAAALELSR